MTLHDAHNRPLHIGDKVFFIGTVERINLDGEYTVWVTPDAQPEGFTVNVQLHPRTVEIVKEDS